MVRLLELTRQTETTVQEVAETIAMDPELTARILRFVNSPLAGIAKEVTSLEQAIILMGMKAVQLMALTFSVLSAGTKTQCPGFDRDHFALHSLGCGVAARVLSTMAKTGSPQEAFAAGLLSQIGRSIFASAFPEEYGHILKSAGRIPADLPELEMAAFAENYATAGAQILEHWGIPKVLCESIAVFRNIENHQTVPELANLIHVGEWASGMICPAPRCEPYDQAKFVEKAQQIIGMNEESCLLALRVIAGKIEQMRLLFELPRGAMRSIDQIEIELRERMVELYLAMNVENQNMARQQEDLVRLATTDSLTGVGNRATCDSRLALEIERSVRTGNPLALLMVDIDHFKVLNDTHGHQAGDYVLQSVSRVLDRNIRKVDYVARYGGDEFVVIAPDVTKDGAMQLAERLRKTVEKLTIQWEDIHLNATVSIGMVIMTEIMESHDRSKMMNMVDARLYDAKSAGRNRIEISVDHEPVRFTRQPSQQ